MRGVCVIPSGKKAARGTVSVAHSPIDPSGNLWTESFMGFALSSRLPRHPQRTHHFQHVGMDKVGM